MAVTTLRAAITQIQTYMLTLSGMREAPTDPPEQPHVFPFAICAPYEGAWERQAEMKRGLQVVTLDIHVARKDLPRDVQKLADYEAAVPNILLNNVTLNGTVDTIEGPIRWRFLTFDWGGPPGSINRLQTIGFRFYITLKLRTTIT